MPDLRLPKKNAVHSDKYYQLTNVKENIVARLQEKLKLLLTGKSNEIT